MNPDIVREIQQEQDHGRAKHGNGPHDIEMDDHNLDDDWHRWIKDHNERAKLGTPMERRQHLIKVAGLAVSAIEVLDRKRAIAERMGRAQHDL